jgi:2-dehydropantoate 2-reductase
MALAVHLANAGKKVTAVRTSTDDMAAQSTTVTLHGGEGRMFGADIDMISLSKLDQMAGLIIVTAKSYANRLIAAHLSDKKVSGPVVILQNGLGVEQPYLDLEGLRVYRCVLYMTSQKNPDGGYTFMPVTSSPIGVVRGTAEELEDVVSTLSTGEFPFTVHANIQAEVWKKVILNAVFNSICPLLNVDNGIFVRDEQTARLARDVVDECLLVMHSQGFGLSADDVMQQLFAISRRSDGQLISTLQDLNAGRETEMDYLNLEIARAAAAATPPIAVNATRALGELIQIKSRLRRQ